MKDSDGVEKSARKEIANSICRFLRAATRFDRSALAATCAPRRSAAVHRGRAHQGRLRAQEQESARHQRAEG
eukprot:9294665-Pyramimonas_sp.AAC.1